MRRTFQLRFEELGDGNVIADILGDMRGQPFQKQIETSPLLQNSQQLMRKYLTVVGSSSEEEQVDNTSEVDLTTAVNWQEQAVIVQFI